MDENALLIICTAGVLALVILIILFANWMDYRMKKKQSKRLINDLKTALAIPKKKYFGNKDTGSQAMTQIIIMMI